MEDSQQLGGNIELAGFREIDGGSMIVLKKIIGNYARRFSDRLQNVEKLSLTLKKVHDSGGSPRFEVHCLLAAGGQQYNSDLTDFNLFFVTDKVLKNIESTVFK